MTLDNVRPTHTLEDRGTGTTLRKVFNATQVRLYGIHQPPQAAQQTGIGPFSVTIRKTPASRTSGTEETAEDTPYSIINIDVGKEEEDGTAVLLADKMSVGIIYSYAYEGRCYELAEPKVMLIPAQPTVPVDGDCGYDDKAGGLYRVWVVDKSTRCVELDVIKMTAKVWC